MQNFGCRYYVSQSKMLKVGLDAWRILPKQLHTETISVFTPKIMRGIKYYRITNPLVGRPLFQGAGVSHIVF